MHNAEPGVATDRKAILGAALRRRILTMELGPGASLDEVALSEEFGLSRPPVRELMRQMAGEGYIELEPNKPARVTPLSYQTLRDFFLVSPLIYAVTTRLAAERRTKAEIDDLRVIQEEFRAAIAGEDVEGRVYHNERFHLYIGEMAHNAYLLPSLRRCLIDHARIGKIFYQSHKGSADRQMADDRDEAVRQHDEIIDAIERHDPDTAEALVRAHLDLSRRHMAMYATPEGLNMRLDP